MAEKGIPGQYYDTGALSPCRNTAHGCGYLSRDGQLQRTLPLFAAREMKKRQYKILYNQFGKQGKPFFIGTLCNDDPQLPMLTFDDAIMIGEEWNGRLSATMNDHTQIISRDQWRVQCGSAKWGFYVLPLPCYIGVSDKEQAMRTSELLRLVAGTPVWPGYMDWSTYRKSLEPLRAFGVEKGLPFWACWQSKAVVGRREATTEVAVYRNANDLLLIVGNFADQPAKESLQLHLDRLGLSDARVTSASDVYGQQPVTINDNRLETQIAPKHFQMILVQTAPGGG
jgi:hypothetical protein